MGESMSEEWLTDYGFWFVRINDVGKKHGLNPALREFFVEFVAAGREPEQAACEALEACEITKPIAEL